MMTGRVIILKYMARQHGSSWIEMVLFVKLLLAERLLLGAGEMV